MIGVMIIMKKIKGLVANNFEYKISGKVKILNEKNIFAFKKGDILVAESTNQKFLPAMLKAKAIITEFGGLLSHSAIISREFNIPCIVGATGILDCLNDGECVILFSNGEIDIYD